MSAQPPSLDQLWPLLDLVFDGNMSDAQAEELEALLSSDTRVRTLFAHHVQLRSDIRFLHRAEKVCESSIANIDAMLQSSPPIWDAPANSVPTRGFSFLTSWDSSGWPVAYLIAAVILGIGAIIGAFTCVSQPASAPKPSLAAANSQRLPKVQPTRVGRITGMVNCKWADPKTEAFNGANVPLGRKYVLKSGLMEIAYDTGAKVILEGPVTYGVESMNGGFLLLGKLTGRVEVEAAKGFSVRTPTAIVTDLGTEFGVQVDGSGETVLHGFRGAIEIQAVGNAAKAGHNVRVLRANQSACVRPGDDAPVLMSSGPADSHFVRAIPNASNGDRLANLRIDYDHHHPVLGGHTIPDNSGDGIWAFYASRTENPDSPNATLVPLAYTDSEEGYRAANCYAMPNRTWGLPAVKNGQLIMNQPSMAEQGILEDAPPSDSVAVHPGVSEYLVIRWVAGKSEGEMIRAAGIVRDIGAVGNGITFAIFADGIEVSPSRVVALYGGPRFDCQLHVQPGSHIDFVVGNNGQWTGDQSSLSVDIVRSSEATKGASRTRVSPSMDEQQVPDRSEKPAR